MVFGKNMGNNQNKKRQNARISVSTKAEKFKMATISLKHFAVKDDEKLRYWNARSLKFR